MKRKKHWIDPRGAAMFIVVATVLAFAGAKWFEVGFWTALLPTVIGLLIVGLTTLFDD